jgi:hypothetical protein
VNEDGRSAGTAGGRLAELRLVSPGEDDAASFLSQRQRDSQPDAASTPGDQGFLAGQVHATPRLLIA